MAAGPANRFKVIITALVCAASVLGSRPSTFRNLGARPRCTWTRWPNISSRALRDRAVDREQGRQVRVQPALDQPTQQVLAHLRVLAGIFNNDAVLTSALLDRLSHHAATVLNDAKIYRANVQVEV